MIEINKNITFFDVIPDIIALAFGIFIGYGAGSFNNTINEPNIIEESKNQSKLLQDSVVKIKIQEDEELKVLHDADNDSVVIIFKKLVSE